MVWGIASADHERDDVVAFAEALGLTFPILWDDEGGIYESYVVLNRYGSAAFPKDWVIATDGTVAYVNNGYEPDEMIPVIEAELGL